MSRTPLSSEERAFLLQLGERLTALRKGRGLTQVQLAQIVGFAQQRIVSFEKGLRRIPVSALPAFARALDVSVEDLLGMEARPGKRGRTSRLERQLEQLSKLPRGQQRLISDMIEGALQKAAV